MKLDIKVCTQPDCSVTVLDEGKTGGEGYLVKGARVADARFNYYDTVSIDVLLLNKTTGFELLNPVITNRKDLTKPEPVKLFAAFDGWFTICHIVIPNKDWFDRNKEELDEIEDSSSNLYDRVYYSDGVSIFKYLNGESLKVGVNELIEQNPKGTTISIVQKNYVSICFLRKCYINLCQLIFNSSAFSECFNASDSDSDLRFRRDLVWMTLNVIEYLTEFNQLAEVQRLIELLNKCNGVCKDMSASPRRGCGCS